MHSAWRESFQEFFSYMGQRPSAQHSIDRYPDADGDYVPGNVRWATREEQNRNRPEFNVLVPWMGKAITVSEWSKITGKEAHIVYERIKAGWMPFLAISVEPGATRGAKHIGMKRSTEARARMSEAQKKRRQRIP